MKAASFVAKKVALSVILTLFAISAFSQGGPTVGKYDDHFARFDIVKVNTSDSIYGDVSEMSFTTSSGSVVLTVSPHDLRAPFYRAEDTSHGSMREIERAAVTTYKGIVKGDPHSEVRLMIESGRVEGFFDSGNDRFFLEPALRYSDEAKSGEIVVYRSEDVRHREDFWCSSEMPAKIETGREMATQQNAESVQSYRRLDIATEADSQFVSLNGGATPTNNEILSILNMAEGTFSEEVGVRFRVTYQHTWSGSDPFTGSNTDQLLRSFQNHWNANFGNVQRNTTHLFTGKSYAQSQGFAFFGVVCSNPAFAYGLTGYVGWAPGKYLVTAHEIGHNLGANHADAAQSCTNTLMNAQLSGSTPLSFCGFSRGEIGGFVAGSGSCLATISNARTAHDFDGDGRADTGVFRPGTGVWYLNRSSGGFSAFQFGSAGDRIVSADFDGDGKVDPTIYRNGVWWRVKSATNTVDVVSFGLAEDIPTAADFDGDGKADVAVFRPSIGTWYRINSGNGNFSAVQFGTDGDRPVAADFDGDGKADINLFRPSNGAWYRLNSTDGTFSAFQYGITEDIPLVADLDGDRKSDIAVWRPSTGVWYWVRSSDSGHRASAFGSTGDIPAPADFDGDGKADLNVFRPSGGVWFRMNSSNGAFSAYQFGVEGDNPLR